MERLLKFTLRQASIENTSTCIRYLRCYSTQPKSEKDQFLKYGNCIENIVLNIVVMLSCKTQTIHIHFQFDNILLISIFRS